MTQKQKIIIFVAIDVILAGLVASIVYKGTTLSNPEQKPVQNKTASNNSMTQFSDSELGLSFVYPAEWGKATTDKQVSLADFKEKITFADQANVYLQTNSSGIQYHFLDDSFFVPRPSDECNSYWEDILKNASDVDRSGCKDPVFPRARMRDKTVYFMKLENKLFSPLQITVMNSPDQSFQLQVQNLFRSMVFSDVPDFENKFNSQFQDKTQYVSKNLGLSFSYPTIIKPTLKEDKWGINSASYPIISLLTLQQVKDNEQAYQNCEGECYYGFSLQQYLDEQKLLSDNPSDGPVKCSSAMFGKGICEMRTINGVKYLFDTNWSFGGESNTQRTAVTYKNHVRYEIQFPYVYGWGSDKLNEYDSRAKASLQYKIMDELLQSLKFQ